MTAPLLTIWDTVPQYLIIPHRVAPLAAAIGGVAFDGVNPAVFLFFHDAYMVGISVERSLSRFAQYKVSE